MLKHQKTLAVLLTVAMAGFVFGMVRLFELRFSAGDIYPAYSTFRTDPLGAKALYEGLQHVPKLSTSRFFQESSKLGGGRQRTLFVIGANYAELDEMPLSDYRALQDFMTSGGRVIISLLPIISTGRSQNAGDNPFLAKPRKPANDPKKEKSPPQSNTNAEETATESISFFAKSGLMLTNDHLLTDNRGSAHSELAQASETFAQLPRLISWHSAGYFADLTNKWRTVYQWKKHPVIVERPFGAGSLVLSTDSYFLSNEAMRKERHAELLAWFLGNSHEIIFDETHLGVEEHPGIAGLMRRYNLEGVIAGLLLVAGLFVWKNSAALVPPPVDETFEAHAAMVTGKETSAGFASLLRRSIRPPDIILTCFEEWKSACARQPRAAARLAGVEQIIAEEKSRPTGSRRPVETYRSIHRLLTQRL
ncbi:MAG TPA: DUF4350 domain-containing protein [Verrucomicrobiae bacterium]|jgi:hypothetical protein|nr:DUF4350 domain-containing protein [Verrucomicrobiae bacterium]